MKEIYIPLSKLLDEELSPFLQKQIPTKLRSAYEIAAKSAQKPIPDFFLESLSDEQGLWVQCGLQELIQQYQGTGITASLVGNKKHRAHLEIQTSRILITSHRVRNPNTHPRKAIYRASNATQNQLWLPGLAETLAPANEKCNMHLLHGPRSDNPSELGFVQLAVPESGQSSYLGIHTLFISEDLSPIPAEDIEDTAIIKLKVPKTIKKTG